MAVGWRILVALIAADMLDCVAVSTPHVHCGPEVRRCKCYFSGRVQGIGFRYTAQNVALQFDINGYVKNLSDGRVEVVMEGCDGEINHFIEALQRRMNGYICKMDRQVEPATGEFAHFNIRH